MQRKDLSLPGAILIVISQVFSSYQSTEKLSQEITRFREDFRQSIVDRDTNFVRKVELSKLHNKIDQLNHKMVKLSAQIKAMDTDFYSMGERGGEIIGCSFRDKRAGL